MEKNISDLSLLELKALAYDQLVQIDLAQNNLRALNQEMVRRLNNENPTINPQVVSPPAPPNNLFNPLPQGSVQVV